MATITLEYDTQNSIAVKTVEYISSLGVFQIKTDKPEKTSGIDRALQDVRAGRIFKAKDAKSLIADCLK